MRRATCAAMALAALAIVGCGSDDGDSGALAEQFVQALQSGDLAPRMTADTAEALYGTDAAAVCEVFDGELSTSARNVLLGNLAQRRKSITARAVAYGRIVVQTYCPDALAQYEDVVAEIDTMEADRS